MIQLYSLILVIVGCVIGAYGGILLKKASGTLKLRLSSIIHNKYLIKGVLIYGVGTVMYIIALRGGELSILYPLIATTYIWTAIFSQKLLGEKMNRYKWIGIILILIGVSLIGIGAK
jgi:drug/metabolite transporter (DMT)-like permease